MVADRLKKMLALSPYSKDKAWKKTAFRDTLIDLTRHHQENCELYQNIFTASEFKLRKGSRLDEVPFLPVNLFKYLDLVSVPSAQIQRTLMSSGTTRQAVSRIYLDKETSMMQMQALASIIADFLGKKRLPLLVLDHPSVVQVSTRYSARAAAIQGFSIFGKDRTFGLNDEMEPDLEVVEEFLSRTNGMPFFLFGFTYVIWRHFFRFLEMKGQHLDLSQGILIHGGGWKHLAQHKISDEVFREKLQALSGLTKIYNYYGMVEQTGSIYMQCEEGHFHCSNLSDIYIRRVEDFSICGYGEPGIIQTISALPYSYPGHNLLTEDQGILLGEDDCPCGRYGKYFIVVGRLKNAELKGCGDVYAAG